MPAEPERAYDAILIAGGQALEALQRERLWLWSELCQGKLLKRLPTPPGVPKPVEARVRQYAAYLTLERTSEPLHAAEALLQSTRYTYGRPDWKLAIAWRLAELIERSSEGELDAELLSFVHKGDAVGLFTWEDPPRKPLAADEDLTRCIAHAFALAAPEAQRRVRAELRRRAPKAEPTDPPLDASGPSKGHLVDDWVRVLENALEIYDVDVSWTALPSIGLSPGLASLVFEAPDSPATTKALRRLMGQDELLIWGGPVRYFVIPRASLKQLSDDQLEHVVAETARLSGRTFSGGPWLNQISSSLRRGVAHHADVDALQRTVELLALGPMQGASRACERFPVGKRHLARTELARAYVLRRLSAAPFPPLLEALTATFPAFGAERARIVQRWDSPLAGAPQGGLGVLPGDGLAGLLRSVRDGVSSWLRPISKDGLQAVDVLDALSACIAVQLEPTNDTAELNRDVRRAVSALPSESLRAVFTQMLSSLP
jgi:hypothetical protein